MTAVVGYGRASKTGSGAGRVGPTLFGLPRGDAVAGATIAAAINAFMTHDPPGTPPELRRTVAQRRADALYDIARLALASPNAPDVAGARPHVVARVNLTDLLATLVSDPEHPDHHRLPGHRRR
jgi:hypothetical protein